MVTRLADAAQRIAAEREPGRLIEVAAAAAHQALGAERVFVTCRTRDDTAPACVGSAGFPQAPAPGAAPPDLGGGAVLIAPIETAAATGFLYAADKQGAPGFDDTDRQLARALAAHIGAAYGCAVRSQVADGLQAVNHALVEQIPGVVYYRPLDQPGVPAFVSPQVEALFGVTAAEVVADPELWLKVIHPDDRARVVAEQATYLPAQATGPVRAEYRVVTRDGRTRWIVNHATAVRGPDGRARFVAGVLLDVTDQKLAEAARRISEAKLRHLVDANVIGVMSGGIGGRIREANQAYLDAIGYTAEDLRTGRIDWEAITVAENRAHDLVALDELRARGAVGPLEREYVRKDGRRVPVLAAAALLPDGEDEFIGIVLDLTARKQLEEQLRQSQKMEAIGLLAGGVAHDFNNLLTVILGLGAELVEQLGVGDPRRDDVAEMVKAGERARELTRQLLAFGRRQVLEPRLIDLSETAAGAEKLLRRVLGEDVELVTRLPAGLHRVRADPGQIEQVILNLAVNARDAMPRGGRLTIETSDVGPGGDFVRAHAGVPPGAYVMLAVSDSGVGMDAATRERVFEPFFTTKDKSRGTGLGLATVLGIVEQSGGTIRVDSEPGRGATFRVYLPQGEAPELGRPAPQQRVSAGGRETILVAEDDEQLRRLTRRILERHGYRVLAARNGREACALAERHDGPIELLLTDVVMPGMSGRELAEQLGGSRPELKIAFMSGYTDDDILRHGLAAEAIVLIQKPFTEADLVGRIRGLLDA